MSHAAQVVNGIGKMRQGEQHEKDEKVQCIGDDCAWWVEAKHGGMCAIYVMTREIEV
jgi:hypothetical protein